MMEISFAIEEIGPERATEYLARNKQNRQPKKAKISALAVDMAAGRFRLHHQGIAFDHDGWLRDGQHRLLAILQSGVRVRMVVARGIDPDVIDAIDQHAKRTFTDFEHIAGNEFTHGDEATLRAMFNRELAATTTSVPALRAVWGDHGAAVAFASSLFGNGNQGKFQPGTNNSVVRGIVARAWYTQPQDRLKEFAKVLETGLVSDPSGDESAIRLRNLMLTGWGRGNRQDRVILYRKTERSLQAFIRREPMKKVTEATTELFPVPSEDPRTK